MLNVTDKAAAAFQKMLEGSREAEGDVLRLSQSAGEIGLAIDQEHEGDQVVEYEERKVLAIESDVSKKLDGATIDVVDSPEGQRLVLQ